jgi:hypothetical protein
VNNRSDQPTPFAASIAISAARTPLIDSLGTESDTFGECAHPASAIANTKIKIHFIVKKPAQGHNAFRHFPRFIFSGLTSICFFVRLDTTIFPAYSLVMRITVELSSDIEQWLNDKVQSGSIASPDAYIQATMQRDYLEERLQESMIEPATPLTAEDWSNVRREVAKPTDPQK